MAKPVNSVFLKIEKPIQDEIILGNGIKLYLAGEYNRQWNATVTGVVTALPDNPQGRYADIPKELEIGDEVAFSYQVVSDIAFDKVGNQFMPVIEENPYCQKFVNADELTITMTAIPPIFGKFNKMWIGLLTNKYGDRLDGFQGDESGVERWLSQFQFSGVQNFRFNNLMEVQGKDFWKCNYEYLYAKKVGNKIVPLGERVICEPMERSIKEMIEISAAIKLPNESVKVRLYDRAKVLAGGEKIGVEKGDVISFEPNYVEKYSLFGKEYFLIKERRVLGKWTENILN